MLNIKSFVGKTIKSIDTKAVNCIIFTFTDGTSVGIEVEAVLPALGLYGIAQIPDASSGS